MLPEQSLFQPDFTGTECPGKFNASGVIAISLMVLYLLLWPAAGMTQIFGLIVGQAQVVSSGSGNPESNSVKEEDSNLGVNPNPASDVLSIHLNDASVIDAYSLRDGTGVVIHHEDFKIPVHVAQLNLKARPVGEYILHVRSGNRLFSKRVVKE